MCILKTNSSTIWCVFSLYHTLCSLLSYSESPSKEAGLEIKTLKYFRDIIYYERVLMRKKSQKQKILLITIFLISKTFCSVLLIFLFQLHCDFFRFNFYVYFNFDLYFVHALWPSVVQWVKCPPFVHEIVGSIPGSPKICFDYGHLDL